MASPLEIDRFKMLIGGTDLSDEQISLLLDNNELSMNKAGYEYWRGMAGTYAHMVTVSENQSRRDLSDLFAHAKAMMAEYKAAIDEEELEVTEGTSGTRPIERL